MTVYLLNKPMDLTFRPALFVKWIECYLVPYVPDFIIWFSTDNTIGLSAASFPINDSTSTQSLCPVHDHAHYD